MYTSHNKRTILLSIATICNGNRTEWSPTRSVIIRAIDKNVDTITDRIWRKEVLLSINYRFPITADCSITLSSYNFTEWFFEKRGCKCTNNIWGIFNGFWLNQILTDTSYLILVRNFSLALQFQDAKRESCFCYTSWNLFRFFKLSYQFVISNYFPRLKARK